MSGIVPSAKTRHLAAVIVHAAADQGADAARLVAEVERGQEVALVGAIACLAARHNRPTAGRPSTATPEPLPVELDLIACPRCEALIHQPCRTEGGYSRADHPERLFPRRCPCGAALERKRGRDYCDPCRDAVDRENQRRALARHRAKKRDHQIHTKESA